MNWDTKHAAAVQMVKDIQMLRAMCIAAAPHKDREKGYTAKSSYDAARKALTSLRQDLRDRSNDRYALAKSYAIREQNQIKAKISSLIGSRRYTEEIIVGGYKRPYATVAENIRNGRPHLKINVRHMWFRTVFGELYGPKADRFSNKEDYLILSAEEYRINTPEVRLWQATAFQYKTKKTVAGYIGQSKLSLSCAFRTTASQAIAVGMRIAALDVTKKIIGEPKDDE